MTVPLRHLLEQGPVLRALGQAALASLPHRRKGEVPSVPGPWIEAIVPARSDALVEAYTRHVDGDPAAYAGHVPPHLFPQWSFPLAARTLAGLPYPLARVVNAGCRIEVRAELPAREAMRVRARLESIDASSGKHVKITQRIETGTRRVPEAIVAEMRAMIPLSRGASGERKKEAPRVPADARAIGAFDLGPRAGLEFALLTGDFNPIHWVPLWARISGFRAPILHGFATLARAHETVVRAITGGDPARLAAIDVKFVRPLVLPAHVVVCATDAGGVWVGDGPGGVAYLEGRFETRAKDPR